MVASGSGSTSGGPEGPPRSALELLDDAIAALAARLGLEDETAGATSAAEAPPSGGAAGHTASKTADDGLPPICRLELRVGVVTEAWVHPEADKLYCESIDCGEAAPRKIASGLRAHLSLEQLVGRRVLVVANLKPRTLVGFPSHGMVLCAVAPDGPDGAERVELVEPPAGAAPGELVTFDGLPAPEPASAAQVDKKKLFQASLEGLRTTEDGLAAWHGHLFHTIAGPCRAATIRGGAMR